MKHEERACFILHGRSAGGVLTQCSQSRGFSFGPLELTAALWAHSTTVSLRPARGFSVLARLTLRVREVSVAGGCPSTAGRWAASLAWHLASLDASSTHLAVVTTRNVPGQWKICLGSRIIPSWGWSSLMFLHSLSWCHWTSGLSTGCPQVHAEEPARVACACTSLLCSTSSVSCSEQKGALHHLLPLPPVSETGPSSCHTFSQRSPVVFQLT